MGVLPQPIDRPPTSARQARPSASDQRRVVLDEYFHAVSRDRERTAAAGRSRRCRVRGVDHWGRDARRSRPAAEWVFCATHGPGHVSCQRRADPQATRRSSRSASRRRSRASSERFLSAARKQLLRLFPVLPKRPGHRKRGERLSDAIEALGGVFAHDSPGSRPTCSWSTRRRSSLPGASRLRGAASSPTPTTATAQAQPLRLGLSPARAVHARGDATRAQPHLSEGKQVRGLPGESSSARIGYRYGLWRYCGVKISFRCLNLPKRIAPRARGLHAACRTVQMWCRRRRLCRRRIRPERTWKI